MATKGKPERVDPNLARLALGRAKDAGSAYSEYIRAHWQATGNLAPGCDAKDFVAFCQINLAAEWGAKGGK